MDSLFKGESVSVLGGRAGGYVECSWKASSEFTVEFGLSPPVGLPHHIHLFA